MPLTRAAKKIKVDTLAGELAHSSSAIVGTFTGLTASKDFALRKAVRDAGGSYHVVKNKLAAKAAQGSKIEAALQGLKGVSSVAYTAGDPVALAKALSTWVKDNAEFTFKLGIIDGKVITVEEIGALATMPGKEELFSKLLFLIQSPAQRLATVLNAAGRDLAVVLGQGVEKEKFSGPVVVVEVPSLLTEASAPVAEMPAAEAPATEVVASRAESPVVEAVISEAPITESEFIAETHAIESASAVATDETPQPVNGTASQADEAATVDPVRSN